MTDWRALAAAGRWGEIDRRTVRCIGREGLRELRDMLEDVLPTVERGHGLETYRSAARWYELGDARREAARLLTIVKEQLGDYRLDGELCGVEIMQAVAALRRVGIEYEGMDETFVYKTSKGWAQLRPDFARALHERHREVLIRRFERRGSDGLNTYRRWRQLYPWRRASPLRSRWAMGDFQINSPEDHALRVLIAYDGLKKAMRKIQETAGKSRVRGIGNKGGRAMDLLDLARAAMEIGRHSEALRKKPFEPLALARIKQKDAFANRNAGRDAANAERALVAEEWRRIARDYARTTALTGMARARWVNRMLESRHHIRRSPKVVWAAIKDC